MTILLNQRAERAATGSTVALPGLSPAFAYADDAARYVHELIGDRRDVEYGGVVLRRPDGQFFATLPVKGDEAGFNFEAVLSTDSRGDVQHPAGYHCVAFYHSHPNTFNTLRAWITSWSTEAIQTMNSFFSPPDFIHIVRQRAFAPATYLSGLNGSLIKYVASGSSDEQALAVRFRQETQAEFDQSKTVLDFILPMARAGELSVLQSSEIWGGKVGKLGPEFKVYSAASPVYGPGKVLKQPACSPIFTSLNAAAKFARRRVYEQPEQQYGYLLKFRGKEQYLATEPLCGAQVPFAPDNIFPKNAGGAIVIPGDLDIVAQYYCDALYRDPQELPAEQAQVFKNFIDPDAMAGGIRFSRALRFGQAIPPLALYIASRDGALLEYLPSNAEAEEPYTRVLSPAEGIGLEIKRDILDGHVTATEYIRGFAAMGQLNVLHPSDAWGPAGRVTSSWQAYSRLQRRMLSPSFISADDAARYAHRKMRRYLASGRVYGGLVYQRLDNRFVVTEPLPGRNETFDPHSVIPGERIELTPHGCSVVAVYHSHRPAPSHHSAPGDEQQLYRNMLEPHEVYGAIKHHDWAPARYLSTPDGALIKYVPSGSVLEKKLLSRVAPPIEHPGQARQNTLQSRLRANLLRPTEYVAQIVRTGELHVVVGSALWGMPGKVTTVWKPSRVTAPLLQATEQPMFSPVFTQAEDAMRYAQHHLGERTQRQFGVILKCAHSEEYVATLPIEGGAFSLDRLFPRARGASKNTLPAEFDYHAVYLGTRKVPFTLTYQDVKNFSVLEAFAFPADIHDALQLISTVHQQQPAIAVSQPVLYIASHEDVLLSYVPTQLSAELSTGVFRESGHPMHVSIMSGRFSPIAYVRQVAASGQLIVVAPSALWNMTGLVPENWRPRVAANPLPASADTHRRFALGPVFSHADDAARYAHLNIERPHRSGRVVGILSRSAYNTFVVVEPSVGTELANAPETFLFTHKHVDGQLHPIPVFPAEYSVASLHFSRDVRALSAQSPVETNLLKNMFWPVDICYATRTLERVGTGFDFIYLSTNDGALLRYWRGNKTANDRLCEYVSGANYTYEGYFAENSQPTRKAGARPSDILAQVLNSGGLRVLLESKTWLERGVVASDFTIRTDAIADEFDWDAPDQAQAPAPPPTGGPLDPWHDEL